MKTNFAVELARDIIEMTNQIKILEFENARLRSYEEKYNNLLHDSIAHSSKMMANTLDILLYPEKYQAQK